MSGYAYLRINALSRAKGHNLFAALAYRLGQCLVDLNTGVSYDYSRKGGVLYRDYFLPKKAKYDSLEELLTDAERSETRINSRIGRELVVGVPFDLKKDDQIKLVREFSWKLVERYRCGVITALQEPCWTSDQRNIHAYIILTEREINEDGHLGAKIRQLDKKGEVDEIKKLWEEVANKYLHEERQIKFESNLEKGKYPSKHFSRAAWHIERRTGQKSFERQRYDEEIAEWQEEVARIKAEAKVQE